MLIIVGDKHTLNAIVFYMIEYQQATYDSPILFEMVTGLLSHSISFHLSSYNPLDPVNLLSFHFSAFEFPVPALSYFRENTIQSAQQRPL